MKLDTNIPISSVMYNGVAVPLVGGSVIPEIFGDGSDGVGLFTANTTWDAPTEDTGMIVKNFESLTISKGATVSAGNRNCGMIIRVQGDCAIDGSLANKMACKSLLDSDGVDFSVYPASMLSTVAGSGGNGGTGGGFLNKGQGGAGQAGRFYGGGYSGGGGGASSMTNTDWHRGGTGGSATTITTAISNIFVGGTVRADGSYGGGGGGFSAAGGSGAGATGGNAGNDNSGGGGAGNYGGGVIILLVGGDLTITGSIDCSGNKGGAGGAGEGAGGGGGGGGRIFICHKGDISNAGVLNVNGGAGGNGGSTTGYGETAANFVGNAGTIGTVAVKTYKQYIEEDVA